MASPTVKLNNGQEIPVVGLGTWQSKPNEVAHAVEYAIKEAGYRHIDGAWAYKNEEEVGRGVKASGLPRSEIFLTSKLWGTYHHRVEECLDQTLKDLGTDYLDLYLIHWPLAMRPKGDEVFPKRPDGTRDVNPEWDLRDTWKQMEAMVKKGKVKSIGVSNCSQPKLEYILETAEIVPAVNQIELHLYNPQHELLAFMKSKGIIAQAYSPLGSTDSPLLKDEDVLSLAEKYSSDPAGILIGYLLAKGMIVLPKSITPKRIASNITNALDVKTRLEADPEELKKLDGIAPGGKQHRFIRPPWGVPMGFADWN